MWKYAEMSQAASNAGGPDQFMEDLVNEGLEKGLKSGRVQGGLVILGFAAVAFGSKKIFDIVRKPKKQITGIVDVYMSEKLDSGIQKNNVNSSETNEDHIDENNVDLE